MLLRILYDVGHILESVKVLQDDHEQQQQQQSQQLEAGKFSYNHYSKLASTGVLR